MIELVDISKTYSSGKIETQALKRVNLVINDGDFLAVLGPSGSGKSTMLNIIGTLDEPTEGYVRINGKNVSSMKDSEKAALRNSDIGFVFQQYKLIPSLTVLENVCMPFTISRENPDMEYINTLMESLGITELKDKLPNQLSGGEKQRVAVVRALSRKPQIILADEPTGNLHSDMSIKLMDLIIKNKTEDTTVVLITHNETLTKYANRVVMINDGFVEEKS